MAKLVDAPASGAGDRKVVGVRVPSWAPNTLTTPYMGSNQRIASDFALYQANQNRAAV